MAKLADKIRRTIGRIPPGRLFDFRPFVHYADGSGLGVVIFRLVKNGTLKKIAKGVYYRPSRRKGQLREPTAEQILDFLTRRGRTILRYESGESLWYKRG